jgi:hypothetical protein
VTVERGQADGEVGTVEANRERAGETPRERRDRRAVVDRDAARAKVRGGRPGRGESDAGDRDRDPDAH